MLATTGLPSCATPSGLRTDLAHKQLYYRPEGTKEIVYQREPQELTLLSYPTGGDEPVGAVIFIHGGGWSIAGPDMPLFQDWVEELNARRIKAFSIEHRISPAYRGMDPIEDSIQAFRYIQSHASDFNIPPDKIAIMGFSSGGHIAVMTGLELTRQQSASNPSGNELDSTEDDIRRSKQNRADAYPPVAVVSFYAPMEPGELYQIGSPGIRTILERYLPEPPDNLKADPAKRNAYLGEKFQEISPGAQLHRFAPPMLLIHGQQDRLVPATQSISFYWKARKIGLTSTKLVLVPRGDHNFNQSRSSWARDTEKQALDYIQSRLAEGE
ncbi:MAG: alpha/beta hydrolase [Leptospiraceae bacterium]|nr:alpha/beta hydrolase [Leptospiraceae bacterium]MCB1170876.1 alpha/beta hydrolase [Leptospiraceae bacterium]